MSTFLANYQMKQIDRGVPHLAIYSQIIRRFFFLSIGYSKFNTEGGNGFWIVERIQLGKREQNIGVSLADICPACITNAKDSFRISSAG